MFILSTPTRYRPVQPSVVSTPQGAYCLQLPIFKISNFSFSITPLVGEHYFSDHLGLSVSLFYYGIIHRARPRIYLLPASLSAIDRSERRASLVSSSSLYHFSSATHSVCVCVCGGGEKIISSDEKTYQNRLTTKATSSDEF